MNNIMEVTGLNKSYKDFSLKDINFTLKEDCITGFIGINGAGKTTTIKNILGLSVKDSGNIKLFGEDFHKNERELKDRLGVVLDEGCFYEELSIVEMKNIIAPAYSKWSNEEFDKYLKRFSLNKKQKISTLSKGMKMKFSLALALSHSAELLIMDEPTSGLDPLIRSQFMDIVKDYMRSGGKSVFFSTHITSDLDKIADILILIHNGKIIFQEEKDSLLENYRLVKGDIKNLNENKHLFLNINSNDYGFTGITNRIKEVKNTIPNILIEKPTIEDIMLGFIEGVDKNAINLG